jgi:polyisoprenoid-binding protein YceI
MNITTTPSASAQPTSTRASYTLDASHSNASFTVRHLMISNVRGEFQKLSGSATYDPARPAATTLQASIDVASINTREAARDTHLKSADFFDVEKYPAITFVSKRAVAKDGGDLELVGDLTIHGTTREVALAVTDVTPERKDPWGNVRIGATASARIKRSDFGMTWNSALETGGVLVGDEVKIHLEVELVRDK